MNLRGSISNFAKALGGVWFGLASSFRTLLKSDHSARTETAFDGSFTEDERSIYTHHSMKASGQEGQEDPEVLIGNEQDSSTGALEVPLG